jgi:Arc/MetJ-type ribon-helix-helix transcriptional regulator
MPTPKVNLTKHSDSDIESGIAAGRFSSASEVEREDQARLAWLRAAAKHGFDELDRGKGDKFESIDQLGSYIDQTGEEASTPPRYR